MPKEIHCLHESHARNDLCNIQGIWDQFVKNRFHNTFDYSIPF